MCQYSAEDGTPGDWHLVHLGSRALGGAGLVMTEMTDVEPRGPHQPRLRRHVQARARGRVEAHRRFRARRSPARGSASSSPTPAARAPRTPPVGGRSTSRCPTGDWPISRPRRIPYFPHSQVPREMDRADMDAVRDDFVARRRHGRRGRLRPARAPLAHGYLLASFLSPLTNRRSRRLRRRRSQPAALPAGGLRAVRAAWPAAKPISVRISATDWEAGRPDAADDASSVARALTAHGCDIVDVSAGQTVPDQRARSTAACTRRRSPTGSATRPACPR